MAYYVTVIDGVNAGKTFRVEPGECVVGRAPSSTIVLEDESVAWEHAMLREHDGRLILQNLAAHGTQVKGRRVTDEVKISSNDEIELSDQCRIRVHHDLRPGVGPRSRRTILGLAGVAVVIVVGAAMALVALREPKAPPVRLTAAHWRLAYRDIEQKMIEWVDDRSFPKEALTVYQEAWRLEKALNYNAAAAKWEQMRSLLLTLPLPDSDGDTRIAEHAGPSPGRGEVPMALDVRMGRNQASSTDYRWQSSEAYASALVWFVRFRARECRRRGEG